MAAIRYITNGTYLGIMKEMLEEEVAESLQPLKDRVAKLVALYEESVNNVKECGNQDRQDFLARRLYEMTAEIFMALLIIADASKAPELFEKSANVYVRLAEEAVIGNHAFIANFKVEDLEYYKSR